MAYTTIDDPSAHFTITLYTGSSNTGHEVTNSANAGDFKPDWLWIKNRSGTYGTRSHELMDSNRGANKALESDDTEAEFTRSGTNSFNTNGFTVGDDLGVNSSDSPSVAWQWKANGGTTSSNTDGSITSTVQANTTAGFSIVTYTGTGSNATVGHGLGVVPALLIIKRRDSNDDWCVYHHNNTSSPEEVFQKLSQTSTASGTTSSNASIVFNDTAPTSSVFSIGTSTGTNANTGTYVAYCFAEIQGYSKFGSYEGNNSTDGTFVYTGFKPAWVMVKNIDAAYGWQILDNKRDPHNVRNQSLFANLANAEDVTTADETDFLSNGFKNREGGNSANDNYTYIYMAFAEHPFVSSKGVPVTAG